MRPAGRPADQGGVTNQAESFLSRLGRAEIGTRHQIAGPYLARYAAEMGWRKDRRRKAAGEQMRCAATLVIASRKSDGLHAYRQSPGTRGPSGSRAGREVPGSIRLSEEMVEHVLLGGYTSTHGGRQGGRGASIAWPILNGLVDSPCSDVFSCGRP